MAIDIPDLVGPARAAISLTAAVCALQFWRALGARRSGPLRVALGTWLTAAGAAAFACTHTGLVPGAGRFLPFGVAPGFALAVASLFWAPSREAFDALSDADVRMLMAYRAAFGAFLFAGAALRLFPPIFAMTAGLGDLLAGWLAAAAPTALDRNGPRSWRALVHGWGALDLLDVAALGTFVVRPWLISTGSPGPSLLLPWVAVPLLFALNLHGLRRLRSR